MRTIFIAFDLTGDSGLSLQYSNNTFDGSGASERDDI